MIRTESEMRAHGPCVLVPTMGALHAGHVRLIQRGVELADARGLAGGCVVSVFVNPTQFNERVDFERYPRDEAADLAKCRAAGASAVFAPAVATVYPEGVEAIDVPELPPVATEPGLEDAHRPGHFAGVWRVVRRLFELVEPEAAVFGEKDWQQLALVRVLAARMNPPIEIIACKTVREPDGVAMSSRNTLLTPPDREAAAAIPRALAVGARAESPAAAESAMTLVLESAGLGVEYAVVRDAATLGPADAGPKRALIAVRSGSVRLIDNAAWLAPVR